MHYYHSHGVMLRSEAELEALSEVPAIPVIDVNILPGDVPMKLQAPIGSGACYAISRSKFLSWFNGIGRYSVQDGNQITYAADDASDPTETPKLVTMAPLGVLLLQRKVTCLHASAVAMANGAVLIVGRSVSGKSTMAAWLASKGGVVLADDFCSIFPGPKGGFYVNPVSSRLRLWPRTADHFPDAKISWPLANSALRKALVEFPQACYSQPVQINRIVVLDVTSSGDGEMAKVGPQVAAKTLIRHIYGRQFLTSMGMDRHSKDLAMQIAQQCEVYRITRLKSSASVEDVGWNLLNQLYI